MHGTAAYTAAVEQTLAVTRAGRRPDPRGAAPASCWSNPSSACWSSNASAGSSTDYQRWNARLVDEQLGFVTPTRHRGRVCTRFAIVNPQTTADDLALLIDSMR